MRRFIKTIAFVPLAAAWAAEPPVPAPAPVPVPVPVAPAASEYAAFDAGLQVGFIAEPNIYRAYLANPAYFNLLPKSFVAGDVGGDLSFGGFDYSRDGGSPGPGPTDPAGEAGMDISYTAGLGARGLGAYRQDFWNVGGAAAFDRTTAGFSYNGAAIDMSPLFDTGDGWTDVDATSQSYAITAVGSAAFDAHVVGGSFAFRPERLEGDYTFEFLPGQDVPGGHNISEAWGRRELKDYQVKAGYSFRGGEKFDVGGAAGFRALRSAVDWMTKHVEERESVEDQGHKGGVKLQANGFTLDGDGRYFLMNKIRVGGAFSFQRLSDIPIDFYGEDWDLVGPFGEREAKAYRLADAQEQKWRLGGGLAFYPDERTTLAFDYGYDRWTARADVFADDGALDDELKLSAFHTYTQLGVERWVIDNLACKAGWRQNLFSLPRNVFFAGVYYKFDDNWHINYDYTGGQLTVNNISLFVPFNDVVKPASHRFTVVRYF